MTETTDQTAVTVAPARQIQRVENLQPMLDSGRFEHFQRAAKALMHSTLLNPSVRGSAPEECFSNLMMVFDLSDRWKLPALSIAQCIAIVHGKVVYEGKLIAAMLTASLGVRLHYHYTGERGTDSYRVFVADRDWADLSEEDLAKVAPDRYPRGWRVIDGSVGDWKTYGKDGRTANPAWTGAAQRNQLSYRGSREWARLYEPAQLLGVYGDDELDDMQVRMERARDVTPIVPGLSSGFTRPAKADPDATVIEGAASEQTASDAAQDVPQAAQDADQEQTGPVAAEEPAGDQEKAPAPKKAAAKKKAAEAPADDRVEISAHQAFEHGLTGGDVADLITLSMPKGETAAIEKAWKRGRDELDALLEHARAAGHSGTAFHMANPPAGDASIERQTELVKAAYAEGQAARAEEEKADASSGSDAVDQDLEGDDVDGSDAGMHDTEIEDDDDDSALDAIGEAEEDLVDQARDDAEDAAFDVPDALDAWADQLGSLADWKSIKSSLGILVKSEDWKAAGPARQAATRAAAWRREAELIESGQDRLDFINDLTAWRCWIETTTDVDAINGNWMTIVRMPLYQGIEAGQKAALEQATLARVAQIQADAQG